MLSDQENKPASEQDGDHPALLLSLNTLERESLPLVGGKAANLGELIHGGFSVPAGFCVTTAAYALVSAEAGLESTLTELATMQNDDAARLAELAVRLRTALEDTPIPHNVAEVIVEAYRALGDGKPVPVAVRSSATAEDLPEASFAGQQETYLNIIGSEALLTAIRRCWASLWTERAVSYRKALNIDPRLVRLAVVVQHMVSATTAGVLFTANPLTGKRHQSVIDANPGLGEAVVAGLTNPDHFVVHTDTGEIIERRLGEKQQVILPMVEGGTQIVKQAMPDESACLSDTQVRTLAQLGAEVEKHFEAPQDIEWAMDASHQLFLLQARPITTLFPLPEQTSATGENLRVYLAFGVQQGTSRPFTPMGLSALRLITSGFLTLIGHPPVDPLTGPGFVKDAAGRPFFDVTRALRSAFGRRFLIQSMEEAEVRAASIFQQLIADERLSLLKTSRLAFGRAFSLLLLRSRLPWYLLQAILSPKAASRRVQRCMQQIRDASHIDGNADAADYLVAAEHLLMESARLLFKVSPVMLAGTLVFALAKRLLGDQATERECQIVLRGSPYNPTIQMNLALWRLSEAIHADTASRDLIYNRPAAQLAQDYQQERLPSPMQQRLTRFLRDYGHQGVCELDLGVSRWSENPTYVLSLLTSLWELRESGETPDVRVQRAAEEAHAMIAILSHRAAQKWWLRGRLVAWCLRRTHALAGFREMPRFAAALLLSQARVFLWRIGENLVQIGSVAQAADIFYLTLPEVHGALAGANLRETVSLRRAAFDRELRRRHVPLVLLSDGTEPAPELHKFVSAESQLQGMPASPGVVTGTARVILDPREAALSPGEILVAPSTDPGWTPLFLKAAGLVMETGGATAHGAIVAREYGIPAVVGVAQATERIATGSRITVDGTTGIVMIDSDK